MNKGKFASLIMLSAFVAGVASSSAVSAQGDKNLAKIVNEDSKSYGDLAAVDSKVSGELAVVTGKFDANIEVATDEETKTISTDDNDGAGNVNEGTKNKTKKIKIAKGSAVVAGGSAVAIGGATTGIVRLVKSLGSGYKEDIKESSVASTDCYEPDNTNTGSGTSPKSVDSNTNSYTGPKSDSIKTGSGISPKFVDTNINSCNDPKSGGAKADPVISPESGAINTGPNFDDTNTEPDSDSKPNNLNQNEKSNNLKKSGIVIGTGVVVIILFWVYFSICHNLENKIKNKIIRKKDEVIGEKLSDNEKFENKLNIFFKQLGRNNIFALSRLNNLINLDNKVDYGLVLIIDSVDTCCVGLENRNFENFFNKVAKIIKKLDKDLFKKFIQIFEKLASNICRNNLTNIIVKLTDEYSVFKFVKFINILLSINNDLEKQEYVVFTNFKKILENIETVENSHEFANIINFPNEENGLVNFSNFISNLNQNGINNFKDYINPNSAYISFSKNFAQIINVMKKEKFIKFAEVIV